MGKITRFNSEAYAIIEASLSQGKAPYLRLTTAFTYQSNIVEQNKVIYEKIHKRLDKLALPGPNVPPTATSATTGSAVGSVSASSYLGPSSGYGPQILLKIHIAEHADAVHVSTTIPVYVSHPVFSFFQSPSHNKLVLLGCICKKRSSLFAGSAGRWTLRIMPSF